MSLILDIVERVVPRVLDRRAATGGNLKEILEEELKKEVGQVIKKNPEQRKNTLLPFERYK